MFTRFFLSERNVLIAILLNAAIIFLLYFPAYSDNLLLEQLDHFFLLFFVVEAIVKIRHYSLKGYFQSGWNTFDFAIVAISLPSVLALFIPFPNTSVLLALRVLRLIRLMRLFRFIPHIDSIVAGLVRAVKASLFVVLALFITNFLLALFTCHFYGQLLPDHFGNPLLSSYTIFQLFTLEGWNEIPELIAQETDNPLIVGVSRGYFLFVVLLGGIFGLSLANAIFVDEMTIDNTRLLEDKIDQLQEQITRLQAHLEDRLP